METILASAVSRGELVMGKFLLVLTTSLIAAALSTIREVAELRASVRSPGFWLGWVLCIGWVIAVGPSLRSVAVAIGIRQVVILARRVRQERWALSAFDYLMLHPAQLFAASRAVWQRSTKSFSPTVRPVRTTRRA